MSVAQKERIAWLRLYRSPNVGPITFKRLIAKFGSAEKALEALPDMALRGGKNKTPKAPKVYTEEEALAEIREVKKLGGRFCLSCDDDYPESLLAIEDTPAVLTLLGRGKIDDIKPNIAIVGARNASINGRKFTHKLAKQLGEGGVNIVSGLARGIDSAAHEGALNTGTWAVVAGGADVVYPRENQGLYEKILKDGLIISENKLGTSPAAHHFPRRNRIVSGLSLGTVIVEANTKSGSLITARMAAEQGRDVYAVPGFPNDPRAGGPNKLLRDGAILVESAEDILSQIASPKMIQPIMFDAINQQEELVQGVDLDCEKNTALDADDVVSMLSHVPISVDEIVRACHVSVSEVQSVLLDLEIAGRVERLSGNRVGLVDAG